MSLDARRARSRVWRIADDVWALRLTVPYPNVSTVNAYLLTGGPLTLVDCGTSMGGGWATLSEALAGAGVRPSDIELLVCTHGHSDHYGLAADLIARVGCTLSMAAGPRLAGDVLREPSLPLAERLRAHLEAGTPEAEAAVLAAGMDNGDGAYARPDPDVALVPGARLAAGARRWEVVATPGHSADQIGLWDPARRWLISADLVLPGVPAYIEFGTRPDAYGDYLTSIARATALAPELLLPGHGRPVPGPAALLAGADAGLRRLAGTVLQALNDGPRTAYEIALVLGDGDPRLGPRQRALAGASAVLTHLETGGTVRSELADGVRQWRTNGGGRGHTLEARSSAAR
jgi:glyoxylase-like metal-dependent hydrolase (beta-lactamase superfamily II)